MHRFVYSAAAILALVVAPGCGDDGETDGVVPPTSAIIGSEGGTVSNSGASITIPAGALDEEVEITVGAVDPPVAVPSDVEAVGDVYRFTPHGQQFATPVTIAIPYSVGRGGLAVLFLDDPSDATWEAVPGAAFADGVATFSVEHLSFYVVSGAAGSSSALVAALEIPGGAPGAVLVNGEHDLVVFDASTDNDVDRPHLRFFDVREDDGPGTFSFELSEDALPLAWTSGIPQGWMVQDTYHGLVYVLAARGRTTDFGINWDQMWVHIVSGHSQVGTFNYNPDGGDPASAPVDFRLSVSGFTLKESHSEGDNPTRLFVQDIVGGNIEVLELDGTGMALSSWERYSYRERLEENCDWPPDPGPWQCHWLGTIGNTLALDFEIESQTSTSLSEHDLLYITDHNYSGTEIQVLRIAQSGPIVPQALDDIDMTQAHEILFNGIEGLTMASQSDTLYVATGLQQFGDGFLGAVDTVTQTPGVIVMPFADRGDILVDPTSSVRIFVAVADGFDQTPALQVHEIVDGVVVATIPVLDGYDGGRVSGMAYDPEYDLLYLAVGEQILVIRVD